VVEESAMLNALQAAKDRKSSFVTHLIAAGAAKARDIAIAASAEFGVPLYDLDSHVVDLDTVKLVQDKLMAKHRCLPLYRRGKRLFLAVADPTNLHAIDEIKFQTGLGIEAVVVEDDKLQKLIDKAAEQVDTAMPTNRRPPRLNSGNTPCLRTSSSLTSLMADWLGSSELTSKTRPSCASSTNYCWTPSAAARRTSISNPTKRCTASVCASTASSRKSRSRPCSSP
jgi:type II secretory ATPase GspE/PulE/Tfp pilus assembly ATPase PilB-like protein